MEIKTGKRPAQIFQPKGATSHRRIKPTRGAAHYHVMSRTVNGEFLFGPTEKEAFRRMMWRMARFAGVEIFTYAVMGNHFHILVKVPERKKWLKRFQRREGEPAGAGEKRLLEHLSMVYSKSFLKQLRHELKSYRERGMEDVAQELLERFKRRFCDVSLFVKELKERFSRWFNKENERRGTLWMDRFQSVCVEGAEALATMAAYIDLNPVRAGLVDDPLLYEWSGYGEATGGSRRARRGLCKALNLPQDSWESRALERYRLFLYDQGLAAEQESEAGKPVEADKRGKGARLGARRGFKKEERTKVREQDGKISPALALRKRQASFTSGVAIGSEDFVREMSALYRETMNRKRERVPKAQSCGTKGYFVMRE